MNSGKSTFLDHLEELRRRIIISLICVAAAGVVFYLLEPFIMPHLLKPVGKAVFLSPAEAFTSRLSLAFYGGVILSSPAVLLQVWIFLYEGLKEEERRPFLFFFASSFLLFLAGCLMGYFVFVPVAMRFLIGFAGDMLVPMISIEKYISFTGTMVLLFGAVFQMPLAMLFLTKTGILTPEYLAGKRKEAVVGIFVFAAVFTPPDVLSQILLAIPMLALYELSILFSRIAGRNKKGKT